MSAQIINLADARKARQQAREGAGCVRLLTLQEWTEKHMDELQGYPPRWPGGIDDLEV